MSLYPKPVPHLLGTIPSGIDGVRATLAIMVKLAKQFRTDVSVRQVAQQVTHRCRPKDYSCEVTQIQHFVRDAIRYVRDVRDVETIQTPKRTLEIRSGDCDDKALLLAALLESIGYRTRFEALGVRNGDYSHVLTSVQLGRGWIPLETILANVEPGWWPRDQTRLMVAHV